MVEKRRYFRVRPSGLVAKRGKLVVDRASPALDCDVVDLSAGGACVIVHGQATIPERVVFVHSGTKRSSRVVWRNGRRIGLHY